MAETTAPHPDHPDHATARVIAYLDALDHERATLAGRKHFFLDGRIEERHGTDGNTHVLYRGDLRSLLADLAVARAGYLAMEQHAHTLEADLQRASDAINVATARAQRAEAVLEANDARADRAEQERDQLRERYDSLRTAFDGVCGERDQLARQLEAAEAQPCDAEPATELTEEMFNRIVSLYLGDSLEIRFEDGTRLTAPCTHHAIRNPKPGVPASYDLVDFTLAVRVPQSYHETPAEPEPNPLESAVTEARADLATTPAEPEPAPPAPPWLVEAGDD